VRTRMQGMVRRIYTNLDGSIRTLAPGDEGSFYAGNQDADGAPSVTPLLRELVKDVPMEGFMNYEDEREEQAAQAAEAHARMSHNRL
jgi:hypothetical protein